MSVNIYNELKPFLNKKEYEKLDTKYNLNNIHAICALQKNESKRRRVQRINSILNKINIELDKLKKSEIDKKHIYQIVYEFAVSGCYNGGVYTLK